MNASSSSSPYYSTEHAAFRDAIRRFVAREITPNVDAWEAQASFPVALMAQSEGPGVTLWLAVESWVVKLGCPMMTEASWKLVKTPGVNPVPFSSMSNGFSSESLLAM